MKIQHRNYTIREIANGYFDDAENGVRGFGGNLNIRPAYHQDKKDLNKL